MNVRYRDLQWNLSAWVRAVTGPAPLPRLPRGYRVGGVARTGTGPWRISLYRPGTPLETSGDLCLADQLVKDPAEVRVALEGLADLAWIHHRERTPSRMVVTVAANGYIDSIEDSDG